MTIYIKSMVEDDDKEVVAQACNSVADIIRDYGFATLEPCKHTIIWPICYSNFADGLMLMWDFYSFRLGTGCWCNFIVASGAICLSTDRVRQWNRWCW